MLRCSLQPGPLRLGSSRTGCVCSWRSRNRRVVPSRCPAIRWIAATAQTARMLASWTAPRRRPAPRAIRMPVGQAGRAEGARRHDRVGEAQPVGLDQPAGRRRRPAAPRRPGRPRRTPPCPATSGAVHRWRWPGRAPAARSAAGSVSRTPPTVATWTSQLRRPRSPTRRSSTARIIASRPVSMPLVARRGLLWQAGRDQALHLGDQRPPALEGDGQAGAGARPRRAGSGTARSGRAARPARRRRGRSSRPRRSGRTGSSPPGPAAAGSAARPRTAMTTSTRCSSTRGPAIEPSLVTWPTSSVGDVALLGHRRSARPRPRGSGRRCRPRRRARPRRWSAPSRRRPGRAATVSMWPSTARQVGLGGQEQRAGHRLDPLGPQPDLGGRLLAGDVEHPAALAGGRGPRRRAAGWTCRCRARRRPARRRRAPARRRAPGRTRRRRSGVDWASWTSTSRIGRAGALTGPAAVVRGARRADLLDRAPGLALAAAADPLAGGPAALAAAVGRAGRWPWPTAAARLRRTEFVLMTENARGPTPRQRAGGAAGGRVGAAEAS